MASSNDGGSKLVLVLLLLLIMLINGLVVINKLPFWKKSLTITGGHSLLGIFYVIIARFITAPIIIGFCGWIIYKVITEA